jgi:hypothetical protein
MTRIWTVDKSSQAGFLIMACGSSASDPRDQIYGMLGLVEDDDIKFLLPYYGKMVVAFYVEFALALMASMKSI